MNAERPKGHEGLAQASERNGFLLALPSILALFAILLLPLMLLFVQAFRPTTGMGETASGWTVNNFVRLFSDEFYAWAFIRTFAISFTVVLGCLLIGYPLAYFLARSRSRWRGILTFLIIAPMFITIVIRSLGWIILLAGSGPVNTLLLSLYIIRQPLELLYNTLGVVIGLIHALLPFMVLVLLAVIEKIDPALEEAAKDLGASGVQTFAKVIIPLSRPGMIAGSLLVFASSVSVYTTIAMLGGGKVSVVSILIAEEIRGKLDYPTGSALSLVLIALTVALTLLSLRVTPRQGVAGVQ